MRFPRKGQLEVLKGTSIGREAPSTRPTLSLLRCLRLSSVLRSIHDRVIWMHGWREAAEVSAGERRWDAEELGRVLATDVFRVAPPGLRFL